MKAKTKHYSAVKSFDGVVITATHPDAKQQFFAWGSDHTANDMSFYGSSAGKNYGNPDYQPWRWRLTPDGVKLMIHNIESHIDDRDYYPKEEVPIARELLRLLKKVSR